MDFLWVGQMCNVLVFIGGCFSLRFCGCDSQRLVCFINRRTRLGTTGKHSCSSVVEMMSNGGSDMKDLLYSSFAALQLACLAKFLHLNAFWLFEFILVSHLLKTNVLSS